jgi:hypothetical protein
MMRGLELKRWAETLTDRDEVAISEGGLSLIVRHSKNYLEIGGVPLIDTDNGYDELEDGWLDC